MNENSHEKSGGGPQPVPGLRGEDLKTSPQTNGSSNTSTPTPPASASRHPSGVPYGQTLFGPGASLPSSSTSKPRESGLSSQRPPERTRILRFQVELPTLGPPRHDDRAEAQFHRFLELKYPNAVITKLRTKE